jgi:hypothetical protein
MKRKSQIDTSKLSSDLASHMANLVSSSLSPHQKRSSPSTSLSPHFSHDGEPDSLASEMAESLAAMHEWATGNATDHSLTGCDLSRYNLGGRFTDFVKAGAGANGCVVLAKDTTSGGTMVAIKVSKRPGKLHSWVTECNGMKKMRQAACKDPLMMKLAERYLPTCLEVGGTDQAPFIIMHAAPPNGIGAAAKYLHGYVGAHVFAQLVGAVTGMHAIGYTHNDLHNANVVVELAKENGHAEFQPELSLLDFGEIKSLAGGGRRGNWKQDETVFARNAFKLAKCPAEAFFPDVGKADSASPSAHEARKAALIDCLNKQWGIDDEFRSAFIAVIDEAYRREVPSLVPSLYKTAWVQKHQGELERKYPTPAGWCDGAATAETYQPTPEHVPPKPKDPSPEKPTPETPVGKPDTAPVKPDPAWQVIDDPELCAQLCRKCSKKRQYYMCLGGPAKGGCSKQPWRVSTQCHGICTCPART